MHAHVDIYIMENTLRLFVDLSNKYGLNDGHKCDMGFNIASAA